ncbi:MAG: DUF1015 domain-containing protein [Clostridia bacterium]|nr:DUF1015 domain-containing protein [Clostridia bacterium]
MTFNRADILIPRGIDMTAWSVVACDQYTSQPEYWKEAEKETNGKPTALNIILPEVYLESDECEKRTENINAQMKKYISDGIFKTYRNCYIYVERTLKNGKIRRGIIGAADLEDYDYSKGSESPVRATEGTVSERIPPRLKVRMNAKLELPHVMILIDDRKKEILEYLNEKKSEMELIYDFDLMMDSGHLKGYLLNDELADYVEKKLETFSDKEYFEDKYSVKNKNPLVFAVGDGNHSLATAKEYYNEIKKKYGEKALSMPARYALAEIVNLHDDSLEFEAIHRVMFNIDSEKIKRELMKISSPEKNDIGQKFVFVSGDSEETLYITKPTANLTVGTIQNFIDEYIRKNGGEVDYIHGKDVVKNLSKDKNSCGFVFDAMNKNDLFKTVILDGALPRKTFSMGEACDKRFYTEARIINDEI